MYCFWHLSILGLVNLFVCFSAAYGSQWDINCFLLWNRHVPLHMAQRHRKFTDNNQVCIAFASPCFSNQVLASHVSEKMTNEFWLHSYRSNGSMISGMHLRQSHSSPKLSYSYMLGWTPWTLINGEAARQGTFLLLITMQIHSWKLGHVALDLQRESAWVAWSNTVVEDKLGINVYFFAYLFILSF